MMGEQKSCDGSGSSAYSRADNAENMAGMEPEMSFTLAFSSRRRTRPSTALGS